MAQIWIGFIQSFLAATLDKKKKLSGLSSTHKTGLIVLFFLGSFFWSGGIRVVDVDKKTGAD